MMAAWVESEWLAFDLETTGIDKHHDVPVSFALVTLEGGEVVASRYSVVDPGRQIPEGAAAVHGISTEQAQAEGIPLEEAVGEIAGVLVDASKRGVPVVGFNLSYDLTMMDACCRRLDGRGLVERGWAGPVLDPLVMDKELVRFRKGSGSRKLERLIVEFGITNEAAHDARGDAVASALLLRKFAESILRWARSTSISSTSIRHSGIRDGRGSSTITSCAMASQDSKMKNSNGPSKSSLKGACSRPEVLRPGQIVLGARLFPEGAVGAVW